MAVVHLDGTKETLLRTLIQRHWVDRPDPDALRGMREALGEGPLLYNEIDDETRDRFALHEEDRPLARELGVKSLMVVPLVTRVGSGATMNFYITESDRRYTAQDLALAEEVARRAAVFLDNARLYREARDAVAARQAILAVVSHDLKNPLAVIKGYSALLETSLKSPQRLPTDRLIERVRKIDNVTKRHEITLSVETPSAPTTADIVKIERVLSNIIGNAIKYSPEGSRIEVAVCRDQRNGTECAAIEVRDEGVGIPAEDLPHIFQFFHRGSNIEGHFRGTGIGLATAQHVVQQHGGTIEVVSEVGVGSTFTVLLPLRASSHLANAVAAGSQSGNPTLILPGRKD